MPEDYAELPHPARPRFTARPFPKVPPAPERAWPDGVPDPHLARRIVGRHWEAARRDAEALGVDNDAQVFSALLLAHALVGLGGDVLDAGAR